MYRRSRTIVNYKQHTSKRIEAERGHHASRKGSNLNEEQRITGADRRNKTPEEEQVTRDGNKWSEWAESIENRKTSDGVDAPQRRQEWQGIKCTSLLGLKQE
jgi:hypothetical protein